jgi:hypothetical protein
MYNIHKRPQINSFTLEDGWKVLKYIWANKTTLLYDFVYLLTVLITLLNTTELHTVKVYYKIVLDIRNMFNLSIMRIAFAYKQEIILIWMQKVFWIMDARRIL